MSLEIPPTLLELASRSLVRDEALDPSSLQDLPMEFFLPIFLEAFRGGHTHVLRSMVQAWPFPYLPLGTLMKIPHLETLQAILDGIDVLLAMKDRPSDRKLQVLSLQKGDEKLWKMECGLIARECSEIRSELKPGSPGSGIGTKSLTIFADLCITWEHEPLDDFQAYLLHWVKMRKQVVQLYCKRLEILSDSMYKMQKYLRVVHLESIEELDVDSFFHRDTMKIFAPYLGRMSRLHKFSFKRMKHYTSVGKNKGYSRMYAAHLRKLENLREIYICDVFFLKGQLHRILRSHTPLETLFLKGSPLIESDLQHLAECPSTGQLKHLTLRSIDMCDFSPQLFRVLLEKMAGTLETLVLNLCYLDDSHINCILPALDSCSRLTTLSCSGNHMSMSVLKNLLRCTARMSQLRQVCFPVPSSFEEGCWSMFGPEEFLLVCSELRQLVMDLRIKYKFIFCSHMLSDFPFEYYTLEQNGQWELLMKYDDELFRFDQSGRWVPYLTSDSGQENLKPQSQVCDIF